jgi:copper chaperone
VTTTIYPVTGLTCEHCVKAVTSELGRLGGVSAVTVALVPGGVSRVTISCDSPLPQAAVSEALDEAGGYQVADG